MKVINIDTLFIITMAGVFLNLAYQQGSKNPIIKRRAWEKRIEALCPKPRREECDGSKSRYKQD